MEILLVYHKTCSRERRHSHQPQFGALCAFCPGPKIQSVEPYLNERLGLLKSKRKQKKYARMVQKFVEDEFAATLKKFTITEGQILIKLIHRQTGETAFDLIKTLRSGWRAFWYNNTAKLFKMSLKIPFDPNLSEEDYLIEDILQRQFQSGRLEYQKAYDEFDIYELSEQWKN